MFYAILIFSNKYKTSDVGQLLMEICTSKASNND